MSHAHLRLTRYEREPTHTLGWLPLPGGTIIYILEQPWRNNQVKKSCLPKGLYPVRMKRSPKYGMRYHIEDDFIAPRSHCLFHIGNYVKNTLGCPLPGMKPGYDLAEGRVVWNSGEALRLLEKELGGRPFFLEIVDGDPPPDAD